MAKCRVCWNKVAKQEIRLGKNSFTGRLYFSLSLSLPLSLSFFHFRY